MEALRMVERRLGGELFSTAPGPAGQYSTITDELHGAKNGPGLKPHVHFGPGPDRVPGFSRATGTGASADSQRRQEHSPEHFDEVDLTGRAGRPRGLEFRDTRPPERWGLAVEPRRVVVRSKKPSGRGSQPTLGNAT